MTQQPPWPAGPPPRGDEVPYGAQPYGSLSQPYQPRPTQPPAYAPQPGGPQPGLPQPGAAQNGMADQPPVPGPSAPLGAPAPTAVHIEQFEPPKTPKKMIVAGILAALLIVGMLVAALWLLPKQAAPTPSRPASTAPASPTSARPTATANGNGIDFESPDGIKGHWEILGEEWSGNRVTLQLKIDVSAGTLPYQFFAFNNASGDAVNPISAAKQPALEPGGRIAAGQSRTGYVTFAMPQRGPGSIYLASNSRNGLAALKIKG